MFPRLHVYSWGTAYASACTNMTDRAAEVQLNLERPSERGRWRVAAEDFGDGTPNGSVCPDGVDGCRHVLFTSDGPPE